VIIDCHGHYTTAPPGFREYHRELVAALEAGRPLDSVPEPQAGDGVVRENLEKAQLRLQRERGTDLTLLSPMAAGMSHHLGDATTSATWARFSNDLIRRVCDLYPANFVGVGQLPQSPGLAPSTAVAELRRCVQELGFVGINLNPDPSGGWWTDPPLTDRCWYPLYEAMAELDVPAMIHVSASCNPNFHTTGAHYLIGDTAVFMQLVTSTLFVDFPSLRFVIPHGGGAVPYHWGRYRGLALDLGLGRIEETVMNNVFFDTCVYHQPGIDLLAGVIGPDNILFAAESVGAVKGIDPLTGFAFDDTRRYVDALRLPEADKNKIFAGNALRVYPRLAARIATGAQA
jgi:4-oxalmesaconate hydratase